MTGPEQQIIIEQTDTVWTFITDVLTSSVPAWLVFLIFVPAVSPYLYRLTLAWINRGPR